MEYYMIVLVVLVDIYFCVEIVGGQECGPVPTISNSDNDLVGSPPYSDGSIVTYTCQTAYRPQGIDQYTCTNGQWTGGSFSCKAIECSLLEAPSNGRMIGTDYRVGATMNFECNTGYQLFGPTQVQCQSDSNWEPETVPECRIKTCPEAPYIQNGNTNVETSVDGRANVYGAVLGIQCDSNYMKNGPSRIYCNENGDWTESPTCVPVTCPAYADLDAPCVLKSKLDANGRLFFLYCTENATFVHNNDGIAAYCDNGNWDDPTMRCYCDCVVNADTNLVRLENLDAKGFLKHDVTLIWSCKKGATKASTAALKCHDGSVGTPVCNPPVTPPTTHAKTTPTPDTPDHTTDKKNTDTNVTAPGDKDEGVAPWIIVVIVIGLVGAATGAAGALVAAKKKVLCFKMGHKSDMTVESSEKVTEKSATVHYTNETTDSKEKTPLEEEKNFVVEKEGTDETTPLSHTEVST